MVTIPRMADHRAVTTNPEPTKSAASAYAGAAVAVAGLALVGLLAYLGMDATTIGAILLAATPFLAKFALNSVNDKLAKIDEQTNGILAEKIKNGVAEGIAEHIPAIAAAVRRELETTRSDSDTPQDRP